MSVAVQITTRVLPGNRVEVVSPLLREGDDVEVTVVVPSRPPAQADILTFLDSLPPNRRSAEEWADYDREFQRERDAWDK
jgi:hypothetical protein